MLKMEGFQVLSIQDKGEEVANFLDLEKPDLVLIDISLSGEMDGIDLSDLIRTKYQIPVIFVTAYTETNTVKRAMETKPAAYITKPITDEELLSAIRKVLK
jgi:CheY-like chemotaxis protein